MEDANSTNPELQVMQPELEPPPGYTITGLRLMQPETENLVITTTPSLQQRSIYPPVEYTRVITSERVTENGARTPLAIENHYPEDDKSVTPEDVSEGGQRHSADQASPSEVRKVVTPQEISEGGDQMHSSDQASLSKVRKAVTPQEISEGDDQMHSADQTSLSEVRKVVTPQEISEGGDQMHSADQGSSGEVRKVVIPEEITSQNKIVLGTIKHICSQSDNITAKRLKSLLKKDTIKNGGKKFHLHEDSNTEDVHFSGKDGIPQDVNKMCKENDQFSEESCSPVEYVLLEDVPENRFLHEEHSVFVRGMGNFKIADIFVVFVIVIMLVIAPQHTHPSLDPSPGDLIVIPRLYGLYDHFAIYVGDGYIVHLTGNKTDFASWRKGEVKKEKLEDVVIPGTRLDYETWKDKKPLPVPEIIKRCLSKVGTRGYDLFYYNCEHFARWARYGEVKSEQADNFLISVVLLIFGILMFVLGVFLDFLLEILLMTGQISRARSVSDRIIRIDVF